MQRGVRLCPMRCVITSIPSHVHTTHWRRGLRRRRCPFTFSSSKWRYIGRVWRRMTQRHCIPSLSIRWRRRHEGDGCHGERHRHHNTPYHITPVVKRVETWLNRIAQNVGALASRRPSLGVSQAGRCLVPVPFRFPLRYATAQSHSVRIRRRERTIVGPTISLSSELRLRRPIRNRTRQLFAIKRGSLDAPDAAAWRFERRRRGPLDH